MIDPRALSVGYASIQQLLSGTLVEGSAASLLAVKAIIWSVALGSGTSGGVLAPLLIIGGSMGSVLTAVMPAASPGFWPLLAMTATMGGTMRAPLTATFFAVELTGATHLLLPLIAACVTAHTVTVLLLRRSILTEKLARRGHHLAREYRVDPFALTRVSEVMTKDVDTVSASMTLHDAVAFLTSPETRHPTFPVIDEASRVLGIVDPPAVMLWRRLGKHRKTTLGELLTGKKITRRLSGRISGKPGRQVDDGQRVSSAGHRAGGCAPRRLRRLEGFDARAPQTSVRGANAQGVLRVLGSKRDLNVSRDANRRLSTSY